MGSDAVKKSQGSMVKFVGALAAVSLLAVAYFQFGSIEPSPGEGLANKKADLRRRLEGRECGVGKYLANINVPGFHPACFSLVGDKVLIKAHFNGVNTELSPVKEISISMAEVQKMGTLLMFVDRLETELGVNRDPSGWGHLEYKQPMGFFTTDGQRLLTIDAMLEAGDVFLFEGGQFIWPGVRVGYKQKVHGLDTGTGVLETLAMEPLVFGVDNFLTVEECDHIIEAAEPSMHNSGVSHMDKDKGRAATDWRTSTQTWLSSSSSGLIRNVDHRVANLTKVPLLHQESVQVLRYRLTEHYDAHHDCFDPAMYASSADQYHYGHRNRLATVFWYMSDVEEGGETVFPMAGGAGHPRSMKTCDQGLLVKPQRGKVIIFYSLLSNGAISKESLHGGCPVIKGKKWAANKWLWNKPSGYYN
jgi:prolyl 4-hydroxylase